jgi:hypothetical protein
LLAITNGTTGERLSSREVVAAGIPACRGGRASSRPEEMLEPFTAHENSSALCLARAFPTGKGCAGFTATRDGCRHGCQQAGTAPSWIMPVSERLYLVLADLILIVHAAFVAFVVVGLVLIWIGGVRRWSFVRNFWFRAAHLTAIGVVAAQAVGGLICPLTTWENRLRLLAGGEERYAGSFIQHWLHKLMYFEFDERVFTIVYLVFFLAVALSLWLIPPRWPRRSRDQ